MHLSIDALQYGQFTFSPHPSATAADHLLAADVPN
jgi:hypothetical protein